MKKISIVISHFNRKKILYKTLQAYSLSENISDCEFIIVDDCSDVMNDISNIKDTFPLLDIKLIKIEKEDKTWILPTVPFNLGVKLATTDRILMTNPECLPMGDVVKDALCTLRKNTYQVYGCYSVNRDFTDMILKLEMSNESIEILRKILPLTTDTYLIKDGENAWYQHSKYRPLKYCFCVAIYKKDYEKIGGLNDVYAQGKGFGDDDFVLSAKQNDVEIIEKDEPFVLHLNHYKFSTDYLATKEAKKNESIYEKRKLGEIFTCNDYKEFYDKYLKK
jgi:hypothetical protein